MSGDDVILTFLNTPYSALYISKKYVSKKYRCWNQFLSYKLRYMIELCLFLSLKIQDFFL